MCYSNDMSVSLERAIRQIVRTSVESFAEGFQAKHIGELEDPEGVINKKIHNVFISVLGEEIQYYSALVRSFDSSLGNTLEKMAMGIARLQFTVNKNVDGPLYPTQTTLIAELLEKYKRHELQPSIEHYSYIRNIDKGTKPAVKRHDSDYHLIDEETGDHYLIELKIGGDLDNKKARSEKEALFEQYAILSNTLSKEVNIHSYFATAYNRYGEGAEWKQSRVLQFFSKEELLIGKDFWNFIAKTNEGYALILDEYRKSASIIKDALEKIKEAYL